MRGLFGALRRGWRSLRPAEATPFEVACACGRVHAGRRAARAQVIRCAGCGEPVFVLPRSPLPPAGVRDAGAKGGRSPWLLPLAAAALTLAAVVLGYAAVFTSWLRTPGREQRGPGDEAPPLRASLEAGRRLLRERSFRQARKVLGEARARHGGDPELEQLYRQADLLAHLLHRPLEAVVQQAQMLGNAEEWREQFKDYQGRAVLFDDVVRRDDKDGLQLSIYEVMAGEEKARVELGLNVLRRLPLEQPRRLLFGARLASVAREAGGAWVVRFDPDSGVLLTDEGAAAACGLPPLDPELRQLLRRQAEWARRLP